MRACCYLRAGRSWWQSTSVAVPAWRSYSSSRQLPHFLAPSNMWVKKNNVSIWLTSHDGFQNISSAGFSHPRKMGSCWVLAATHTHPHTPTPIISGCKMWTGCLPGSFQIQSCEWELHAWNGGMRNGLAVCVLLFLWHFGILCGCDDKSP